MPITIKNNPEDAGGVNNCIVITIPARGETGWADLVRAAFKKISQHDHTGNENGTQLGVASLEDGAVTKAKINANVAGEGLTKDVTSGALNVKIDDVTIERDAPTNTLRLKDDGVSAAKLNADVAGLGLIQNGVDDSLEVNVDDSTIEIDTDIVRVKDLGIVTAKLADAAITTAKLFNGSVTTDKIADDAVTAAKIPFISDTVASDAVQNDTLVWNATSGQFEPQAGGGGGGAAGINHVEEPDAESTLATWSASLSADFNVTAETSTILRGLKSFRLRKAAKVVASPYVEVSFSVPNADLAKKHLISFDYDADDANYADGDIRLSVIKGASDEIRINGEDLRAGKGTHFAQFQTDHTETSYKLRFTYKNTTDANLVDVFLDTVKVSPVGVSDSVSSQDIVLNVKTTVSPPPTHTNDGNFQIVPFGVVENDTVGGWNASTNQYTIPETGYYDITGCVRTGTSTSVGQIAIVIDGVVDNNADVTTYTSTAQGFDISFTAKYLQKGQTVEIQFFQNTGANLNYGQSGCYFQLAKRPSLSLPESVGSGSDVVLHASTETAQELTTGDNIFLTWDRTKFNTDTTNSFDGTNYTVPESGYYDINVVVTVQSQGTNNETINFDDTESFQLKLRHSVEGYFLYDLGTQARVNDNNVYYYVSKLSTTRYLEKGVQISVVGFQNSGVSQYISTNGAFNQLSIAKRQSAQTVLDSGRDIFLHTRHGTATQIPTNTVSPYTTVPWDKTNLVDTTNSLDNNGVYTVPETGYYDISSQVWLASTNDFDATPTPAEVFYSSLHIDGSLNTIGTVQAAQVTDSTGYNFISTLNSMKYLEKGQTVEIKLTQSSGSSITILSLYTYNWFTIAKRK